MLGNGARGIYSYCVQKLLYSSKGREDSLLQWKLGVVLCTKGRTMKLEIKLFASLQKFMPKAEKVELDDNCTVLDLLKKIGISSSDVHLILVNGQHVELDQTLHEYETVAIFPPVGGG